MKDKKASIKTILVAIVWFMIVLSVCDFNLLGGLSSSNEQVAISNDNNMITNSFDVDIVVNEDNSYDVSEVIDVDLVTSRHGIYRYMQTKGSIVELDKDGHETKTPYYSVIGDESVRGYDYETTDEGDTHIIKIGSEDYTVYGEQIYNIDYEISNYTDKGYGNIYYNIFGGAWQNVIPAGSTFTVEFPKDFDESKLKFYYGSYGSTDDGNKIIEYTVSNNVIKGVLTSDLEVGEGLTMYIPLEKGYFTNLNTIDTFKNVIIVLAAIVTGIILLLFMMFGRDEKIIPAVQFAPPEGIDSAEVGYIIDGNISNTDVTSLIIYFANKGYLKIINKEVMSFVKLKDIPEGAHQHQKDLFNAIFNGEKSGIGSEVSMDDLQYKLSSTIIGVKSLIRIKYNNLYTRISKIARTLAVVIWVILALVYTSIIANLTSYMSATIASFIIMLIGMIFLFNVVDNWYSISKQKRKILTIIGVVLSFGAAAGLLGFMKEVSDLGLALNFIKPTIAVSAASVVCIIVTAFMRKRSPEYNKTMSYLVGLREFIETAELDRMEVIAKDSPNLFYHILPYAYVFGISDILLDKMKNLTLPAPEWLESSDGNMLFNYMLMRNFMHYNMSSINTTLSTPKPSQSSGGGGFSGGGFSGGGFSGGGFGGGGGGSW